MQRPSLTEMLNSACISASKSAKLEEGDVVQAASNQPKRRRRRRPADERAQQARAEATEWYKRAILSEQEKTELVKKNHELESRNEQLYQTMLIQQGFIMELKQQIDVHNELKVAAKEFINKFLENPGACGKCHQMYNPITCLPKALACGHVFCKNCISESIDMAEFIQTQQLMIVCPEDNLKTLLPTGNIDDLQTGI